LPLEPVFDIQWLSVLSGSAGRGRKALTVYAYGDNVFPAAEFSWHPGMSQRLGDFRLVVIPGGHELMFSDPKALARGLVTAGQD
jgi:hypothetical protein